MKILKIVICAALLVAGLCGCEKIDVNKLEGTWTERPHGLRDGWVGDVHL